MNRKRRNIIMVGIAVVLAACMVLTAHAAGSTIAGPPGNPPQQITSQQQNDSSGPADQKQDAQARQDQDQNEQSQNNQSQNDQSRNGQPPAPPSDNGNDSQSGGGKGLPGDNGPNGNGPNGDGHGGPMDGGQKHGGPMDGGQKHGGPMDGGQKHGGPMGGHGKGHASLSSSWYVLFGAEGLAFAMILMYLVLSRMNRRSFDEIMNNKKRLAALIISSVIIAAGLTPVEAALAKTAFAENGGPQQMQQMPDGQNGSGENGSAPENQNGGPDGNGSEQGTEAKGATEVDGKEQELNDTYTSTESDQNVILVKNGGKLTSNGAAINKKSGDSSNVERSDFSGVNAALLVTENSSADVKNAAITTAAKGGNGVFATGENAKVTISDSTISTTGERSSRGLDATYGGTIEASNVKISTQGGSCAAMATDRGEGTVSAVKSTLETNGAGSPVIYSTGNITLSDSTGNANGAQIAVVEGRNSATIKNSEVTCSAAGNRGDTDVCGVMVYQSMSGDAGEGTGNFTASGSKLSISKDSKYYKTAPMFFVTNTDAVIDLTETELSFGSGVLLDAKGTGEWGNEGSNGGSVTLNASSQTLKGDIRLDSLSSLTLTMKGSAYEGAINTDQAAKKVSLTLDTSSSIKLTGDSYVTSLEDEVSDYSNIDFNGYKLYVNGKSVN